MDNTNYKKIAEEYYRKEDIHNTILNYKKAIEINPNDAEAYDELGDVYFFQDDFENAIKCYKKAVKLNPNDLGVYNALGNAYYENNNCENAINIYENLIKIDANYQYLSYENLEDIYEQQGDLEALINVYKTKLSTERHGKRISAFINHYYIANTYFQKGDMKEAISYYEKCLELQPNNSMIYSKISSIKIHQNQFQEALEISLNSWKHYKYEANSSNIGHIYLIQNKSEIAIEWYRKSIELYKERFDKFLNDMKKDYTDLKLSEKGITKVAYQEILNTLKKEK